MMVPLMVLVAFTITAPVQNAALVISVNNSRPLALYKGPSTYRRDARGQPFKSIVVTSKPFGFNNPDSNQIANKRGSTTTTTTTPSPILGIKAVTIPFFSISCTVGSSCSQIISARVVPTQKPTFKPYTREEINKFKERQSSQLLPTFQRNITADTTTTTTTTTTTRPIEQLKWRVRTTTRVPVNNKLNWTSWKWPSAVVTERPNINRNHEEWRESETGTTESSKLITWTDWTPYSYPTTEAPVKSWIRTTSRPSIGGSWISLLSASLNSLQTHNPPPAQQKITPSTLKPFKVSLAFRPNVAPVSQIYNPSPVYNPPSPWRTPAWSAEDFSNFLVPKNPLKNSNVGNHDMLSTSGKKVMLVTGSRRTTSAPIQRDIPTPPPEVSISSHVIGLRVKPKSLFENESPNIERIQGFDIETDGEEINLSDLIMKHHGSK